MTQPPGRAPRLTVQAADAALADAPLPFVELFTHGTLRVEFYRPEGADHQTPHLHDEVYVVVRGTGTFVNAGVRHPFGPGDVLFVPAGAPHRFEGFSDDFATWVLFYGPEGGEAERQP